MLATTRLNTCQWSCRTFPRPWVPVQALHCAAQLGVTTSHRAFQSGCCPTQPGLRRVGYYKSIDGLSCRKRPVKTTTITCSSIARSPVATDRTAALRTFLFNQFVPIGLITAIIVGYELQHKGWATAQDSHAQSAWIIMLDPAHHRTFAPQPGAHAAKYGVLRTATTGIFFISGLNLKRGETQRALAARGAVLYGLASILLITPFLGLAALRLPLQPPELAFGLAVFCCMPTTLSSGVSLTAVCLLVLMVCICLYSWVCRWLFVCLQLFVSINHGICISPHVCACATTSCPCTLRCFMPPPPFVHSNVRATQH